MRFVRDNSLSTFFGVIFVASLVGQSIAGYRKFNQEAASHGGEALSYGRYVASSDFGVAVLENWQSEYLQFFLFVLATIWLLQRGSNESKQLEEVGLESDQKQRVKGYAPPDGPRWARAGGWRLRVYSSSLLVVMAVIFLASWFGQSVTGWTKFNEDQREHDEPTVSWVEYLGEAEFWERTMQNWQSEFLAVGSMTVLSIYLRQRGSPESKPVGSPHTETSTSG